MLTRGNTAAERLMQGMGLHEALGATDPDAWLELDAEARLVRPNAPESQSRDRALVPALALCHRDGRVREAALEQVAGRPELLPLLVIRTADWAGPVRSRARELLPVLLAGAEPETLVPLTALVLRLARRERGEFAREAVAALLQTARPAALEPLLAAPDRATRRFAHGLAVERGLLPAARLALTAEADDDAVVRRLCAEAALALGPTGDDVLVPLLRSRHPDARSAGVTVLRRAGRHGDARPYLTDRSGLVRACARYVLRQGGAEPLPVYRALCADPSDRGIPAWAPLGLAECGEPRDARLLWPLTAHPVPSVRARAVAGLRLLGRTDLERLRPLLDDPAPAVAREAATALLPWADRLPEGWLLHRLTARRSPAHTRLAAFRLLRARGGVAELRAAVALLDDRDPSLRALAAPAIQQWEPPVGGHHDPTELDALLNRCTHLFSEYVLLRLRWRAGLPERPRTDGEKGADGEAGTVPEPGAAPAHPANSGAPRRRWRVRAIIRAWVRRTNA
ncbi:hypothetical protein [Streptomyces sp. WMMC940]|uniref:hypothetical protein n=1 Tax=Streptomyces sp. WMMC940 TaxID=3015153 RepID=UPI0022B65912|nr:hypothetical protein [Streptomyces sp. WMMC940]MCZ7461377.1 hypothetical protein [Streptomyces sp. WMMC940]